MLQSLPGESGRITFGAAEELDLYRGYLETLGMVAGLLLEESSQQNLAEVMRRLMESTGVSCSSLFVNEPDENGSACAKLHCAWPPVGEAGDFPDHRSIRKIAYRDYPLLSDTLHVGMVLSKHISELPEAEAALFAWQHIHTALCIPLLIDGELEGFIGLFSQNRPHSWQPVEIGVLCTIANSLALALARKRVEQSLEASAARLRALVGVTEDLVIEYDLSGVILNIWTDSQAFCAGLHAGLAGTSLTQSLPGDMAQAMLWATPRVLAGGQRETFEFTLDIDREDRFFIGRLQMLPSPSGQSRSIVALIRDATELMQQEARRQSMLETLNLLEEAIVELSPDGLLLNYSAAWSKLLDASSEKGEPGGEKRLADYVEPDDRAALDAVIRQLTAGVTHSAVVRFRLLAAHDNPVWVEARLLGHRSHLGQVTGLRGVLRDITSSHLQEKRIAQLALHDALTQLPNRVLFEERLHQAVARSQRNKTKVALGFIDLDHFKQINDTLGHKAGDTVLVTLSRRLQSALRETDTLSRWGGDEFVVLLPDTSERDSRRIGERLRDATGESIDLGGTETRLTLSIGFAVYPDDADSPEALMSVADQAMFHAKGAGRNNVRFFQDIRDKNGDPPKET
ncbi:MAG: diguanylate cyclase [Sulfuricella sp.]|nr:diguanylate cyclase [Sulfuricella sp.]